MLARKATNAWLVSFVSVDAVLSSTPNRDEKTVVGVTSGAP